MGKDANGLTPKQESFAQKYVELSNASEAYRQSYNAENMADKTIWEAACRLLTDSKVGARVMELQKAIEEKHNITVDDLVKELEEARALAKRLEQPSAMVAASNGKGKMLGFDKGDSNMDIRIELVTGIDGGPNSKS